MSQKKPQHKYSSSKTNEVVLLFHGAGKTKKQMKDIGALLYNLGYRTYSIEYSSYYQRAEQIVKEVLPKVKSIERQYERIHFIGHSLGGLIIRGALTNYKPKNLGKVIQIATPNQGSKIANYVRNIWLYRMIYGQVSQDLTTNSNFLNSLEQKAEYEVGIIAGSSKRLLAKWLLGFGVNDGRVAVDETFLAGAKSHIVIKEGHNQIVNSTKTLYQIKKFMLDGNFEHETKVLSK